MPLQAHNIPAVSFREARAIQDGHAGYSNPLDEQIFLVNTVNALEQTDEWRKRHHHFVRRLRRLVRPCDGPIVNHSNVTE